MLEKKPGCRTHFSSPSHTILPPVLNHSPRCDLLMPSRSPEKPVPKSEMNSPLINTRNQISPAALKHALSSKLHSPSPSVESVKLTATLRNPRHSRKHLSVHTPFPNLDPTRLSKHKCGVVQSYAANTHCGLVRNYNEDRVSIILNMKPPACRRSETWPLCSYFGVFDGHGGKGCSRFLRDNLHQFLVKDPHFPADPRKALMSSFAAADAAFVKKSIEGSDRSGSCALVVLFVRDQCFIANTGDSRAILSADKGRKVFILSKDHKPDEAGEKARIEAAGGTVYYSGVMPSKESGKKGLGCYRVAPGRLAVSRTFGDIKAKLTEFGGLPLVVVATPQIKSFKVTEDHDFIVMASDGVYDRILNSEIVEGIWRQVKSSRCDLGQASVRAVEYVMNEVFRRRTTDNVTVLFLGFTGIKKELKVLNTVPDISYLNSSCSVDSD